MVENCQTTTVSPRTAGGFPVFDQSQGPAATLLNADERGGKRLGATAAPSAAVAETLPVGLPARLVAAREIGLERLLLGLL